MAEQVVKEINIDLEAIPKDIMNRFCRAILNGTAEMVNQEKQQKEQEAHNEKDKQTKIGGERKKCLL